MKKKNEHIFSLNSSSSSQKSLAAQEHGFGSGRRSKSELQSTLNRGVIKSYNTPPPRTPSTSPTDQACKSTNSVFHELTKETFSFKPFYSIPQNLPAWMGHIQDLVVLLAVIGIVKGTISSSFFI